MCFKTCSVKCSVTRKQKLWPESNILFTGCCCSIQMVLQPGASEEPTVERRPDQRGLTNICWTHRCHSLWWAAVFLWRAQSGKAALTPPPLWWAPVATKILIWSEIAVCSKQTGPVFPLGLCMETQQQSPMAVQHFNNSNRTVKGRVLSSWYQAKSRLFVS